MADNIISPRLRIKEVQQILGCSKRMYTTCTTDVFSSDVQMAAASHTGSELK